MPCGTRTLDPMGGAITVIRTTSIVLVTALVIGLAWVVKSLAGPEAASAEPEPVLLEAPSAEIDLSETDRLIAEFEERVDAFGGVTNRHYLGRLYLNRAAQTEELTAYQNAHDVLLAAHAEAPAEDDVSLLFAEALLALHDFEAALEIAKRSIGAIRLGSAASPWPVTPGWRSAGTRTLPRITPHSAMRSLPARRLPSAWLGSHFSKATSMAPLPWPTRRPVSPVASMSSHRPWRSTRPTGDACRSMSAGTTKPRPRTSVR